MSGIEIAAAAAVAGTALRTVGQFQAATQQARALDFNAAQQRQAGQNERMAAEAEAARVQDQGRRQRAAARNTFAGSGIDAQSGSAAAVLDDLAAGSALDAEIARWRGTQAQTARERQAGLMDMEAQGARRARWWQAGSTLLTGGSRLLAME